MKPRAIGKRATRSARAHRARRRIVLTCLMRAHRPHQGPARCLPQWRCEPDFKEPWLMKAARSQGNEMPTARKLFRIEVTQGASATGADGGVPDALLRHDEIMAELRALR